MIKATYLSLGLAALLGLPVATFAQDSATKIATDQSVINQANSIVLRQKLAQAQDVAQRGDILGAAKLYQECVSLSDQIGSGIPAETAQAVAGLTSTSMILARDAQSRGDLREADIRVKQVLNADPKNVAAIAFKKQNDQMLAALRTKMADTSTLDQVPQLAAQKDNAAILVQDAKVFYDMGKLDDSQNKLTEALKLDPDNRAAIYYQNLIQQAKYIRASNQHTVDTQVRMTQVEKAWVLPTAQTLLPIPNPYATNDLVYTGIGRQAIIDKLNRIRLETVSYDGLPLSEVLRDLSEKSKLRDPEHKGINFLINPNPDQSGSPVAVTGQAGGQGGFPGGFPGAPNAGPIDPATGLPIAAANGSGGGDNSVDLGQSVTVKLNLNDVSLAETLQAIKLVAQLPSGHHLKYSVQDFAVIFSDEGAQTPQLFIRSFKVDPNTFYSGLESVSSASYGSINSSSSGSGGSSSSSSSSGSGQQNGAVVGVVNAFSGAGELRSQSSGSGGGGGGGGGGTGQGSINPLNAGQPGQAGGGGGGQQNDGGLNYVTTVTLSQQVSAAARNFFTTLGVNLTAPPGKAVFFNDRSGMLLVRATEDDLDTIERAIQIMDQVAPQVHIKARFIEVQQTDDKAFGFDWYLGQFNIGNQVVGQGGSSGSLNTTPSAANPLGVFPGTTTASEIAGAATDQNITSGLRNPLNAPAVGTITGILTNPNFQVALQMLQQRTGIETLAEPEAVTTSGRQAQMRATQVITVITGFSFQQGSAPQSSGTATGTTQ